MSFGLKVNVNWKTESDQFEAAQAGGNIAAAMGASIGPLTIGALTKRNVHTATSTRLVSWCQISVLVDKLGKQVNTFLSNIQNGIFYRHR